jgi:triosephosphate isomerase (TIM)
MRTPLIAGNWKMHKTLAEARELVSALRAGLERILPQSAIANQQSLIPEVLICPPVQLLFPMAKAVAGSPIMLGAQNVHEEKEGAFTGEVSAAMLKDTGCTHVIVGHSERRHIFGERNDLLAKKVRAVTDTGMTAIYCVGETLAEREANRTEAVVRQQIDEVIGQEIPADRLVVAYEPVWAIGTGKTATPDQAQQVHRFVRERLGSIYSQSVAKEVRILYGGSVKPGNAAGLLAEADIDGALVGGACLVAEDFLAIISAAMVR